MNLARCLYMREDDDAVDFQLRSLYASVLMCCPSPSVDPKSQCDDSSSLYPRLPFAFGWFREQKTHRNIRKQDSKKPWDNAGRRRLDWHNSRGKKEAQWCIRIACRRNYHCYIILVYYCTSICVCLGSLALYCNAKDCRLVSM
jgi:hypothetical protein